MANIKFSYLYRDGGNYKRFNSVIFANLDHVDVKELADLIKSKLIDETWFYAGQWQVPELYFDNCNYEVDPTWHEFENIEETSEAITTLSALRDFIIILLETSPN